MKARRVSGGYLLRLERGEEVIDSLTAFVDQEHITCATISGIGAVRELELGYFELDRKEYRRTHIAEVVEVISINGNISYLDTKPFVHAHIAIAMPDQKLLGGHFFAGTVAVTLELFVQVIDTELKRVFDPEMGFNFWDL